jgi:hypothetical protein
MGVAIGRPRYGVRRRGENIKSFFPTASGMLRSIWYRIRLSLPSQSESCLAIFNCAQRARGREDRLQRRSAGLSIVALLGVVLVCLPSSYGLAGPLGLGKSEIGPPKTSLAQKAHGFHCRPMYGWDPRLGIYHVHRHEGICRDYQRCLRVMYRCDAIMGRGWEPWSYERWGFDNGRYDKCMLEAGCY